MLVIVQQITTLWTKRTYRASYHETLQAVPEVVALPEHESPEGGYLNHLVGYTENDGFARPHSSVQVTDFPESEPLVAGAVTIRWDGLGLQVAYDAGAAGDRGQADGSLCGAQHLFLSPGQWGQVAYNGRFRDPRQVVWVYRKHVVNIALDDRYTPCLFTASSPLWAVRDLVGS